MYSLIAILNDKSCNFLFQQVYLRVCECVLACLVDIYLLRRFWGLQYGGLVSPYSPVSSSTIRSSLIMTDWYLFSLSCVLP